MAAYEQPLVEAREAGDVTRLLRIAWSRAGSWDLGAICLELEELARQAWGDAWELALGDFGLHTTRDVARAIESARRGT
ncbi:MAG: hypothetical protein QJR13_09595 [Bacillota bacterium]|nr:hypothetical protein [Bacillota bacterium]